LFSLLFKFFASPFYQALRNAPKGAKALTLANVSGAFLVLILGMGLATATAFAEFLWASRKIFVNKNESINNIIKRVYHNDLF
jgi:hypothetical protein